MSQGLLCVHEVMQALVEYHRGKSRRGVRGVNPAHGGSTRGRAPPYLHEVTLREVCLWIVPGSDAEHFTRQVAAIEAADVHPCGVLLRVLDEYAGPTADIEDITTGQRRGVGCNLLHVVLNSRRYHAVCGSVAHGVSLVSHVGTCVPCYFVQIMPHFEISPTHRAKI